MKKFLSILLSLVCLLNFTTNVYAASNPSTISASKSSTKLEYVDGLEIYSNKASSYKLYVLDTNTYYDRTTTLRDPELVSDGFAYIINNSSPVSSSDKNYYITQVAILWYEDYLNGNDNNISVSLKNYIASNTNDTVCYHINKLVNNAKKYDNEDNYIEIEDKDITFSKSGNYYYSNEIEVTTNNLYSTPSIKLHNAPTSASIVSNSVTKDGEGSFKIRIPASSFTNYDDTDFEVNISGKSNNDSVYMYSNYGVDEAIYGRTYSTSTNNVEESLVVTIDGIDNTKVRVKVLDENGDYIKNVKYNIYEGNCEYSTCNSKDLVHTFTTTSTYTTLNSILNEGKYTFVRKSSNSNYDLNEKELVEIADTRDTQIITINESDVTNDYDYDYDNYAYVNIYNSLNDSSNVIKIYKTNGTFVTSYRSNDNDYQVKLENGSYYIIDTKDLVEVYFKITDGELYIKENGTYVEKSSINLDNYIDKKELNNDSTYSDEVYNDDNVYTDEDGTIHIDNLDGISSIDISQDVETTTDVKIDWISNIIDCPPTSLSSTLKYIVGAIVLALGIFLTIKNVKKSKNNI